MVLAERELQEVPENIEIIKSDNWELPVINLGTGVYAWRPKSAFIPYYLFDGPKLKTRQHGITLKKDLSIGVHGPRGATKTLTLSYLLAKEMVLGKTVWNNWPISFSAIGNCWGKCQNRQCDRCYSGAIDYFESQPLDMDKVYTFNSELSEGAVGFTEFQYYVESRTSGRQQNRFLSYQIMQIRKSALTFVYDVQNPRWVDNRFGWSDDCKIFCKDVAKMNYDFGQVGREIKEGEYSHWRILDISGVITGNPFEETEEEYGPFQFDGYHFWWIYPTRWKIDVYEAVYSMQHKDDKDAAIGRAIEAAINSFLEENKFKVQSNIMWQRASELGQIHIEPSLGGKVLSEYGIPKSQNSKTGKYFYDLSLFKDKEKENK